ncbi:MAG: hypothetical protein PUK59_04700 [Actinomycetaceae bacterium]|nr:hypothetical protein [Actinomycetaceae bacterium]MDY5273627.1 hypothetical protein [Arcanobacterium sp.]
MRAARKQRKHAIDELTEFTAITHRWRNQSHGTISQSKQGNISMNTLPPYPGYDEAQTLAAMLNGTNPVSADLLLNTLNELIEKLPLDLQIIHTPSITQSEPDLLRTETNEMHCLRQLTYLTAASVLPQLCSNRRSVTHILKRFSNKLFTRRQFHHSSFLVGELFRNFHPTRKGSTSKAVQQ